MVPAKRFSVEQIVAKLREAEKLQGQGMTIPQSCKRLRISDQTFYRWRLKYGALKEDEAQRPKALEQENARLKRIERLWRAEGHRVPPRRSKASGKRAQGSTENASWNLPATHPNHVWSYDFVSELTRSGGPIRILNVVDEFTRVSLGSRVARSIGSREVERHLERLFARHGRPQVIRSDNGREFIATTLGHWPAP